MLTVVLVCGERIAYPISSMEELTPVLIVAGLLAIPIIAVSFFVAAAVRRGRHTETSMKKTAEVVGLKYSNHNLRGEQDGVKFQIAMQRPEIAGEEHYRYIVRAKVPGLLPLGLVAEPYKWTSSSDRNESTCFSCGHEALDKAYVFRTHDPEMSRKLFGDPEVREALVTLMQRPPGAGLVFDDHVYIAYEAGETYPAALEDPEEVRRCIDTVVKATLTMDRVYSRLKEQAEAAQAS